MAIHLDSLHRNISYRSDEENVPPFLAESNSEIGSQFWKRD